MRTRILVVAFWAVSLTVHASTVSVTNANNSGPNSLRSAIAGAAAGDTIAFAPGLAGQTIILTSGKLQFDKDLSITGPGTNQLRISGHHVSRIFSVVAGTVSISGVLTTGDLGGHVGLLQVEDHHGIIAIPNAFQDR